MKNNPIRLLEASRCASDKNLTECITKGVAFHSAGMSVNDRKLVERLFLTSDLKVVCTTSTLGWLYCTIGLT